MFNVVAFASDDFHVFSLADKMKAKGWLMGCLQYPTWCATATFLAHINTALNQYHFSLFSGHIYLQPWHIKPGVKERLLKDIREVAKELMDAPKEKLEGRVCG